MLDDRYLSGNPMTNISLSASQATILANLTNLTIDRSGLNTDCWRAEERDILEIKFCVFSDDQLSSDTSSGGDITTPTQAATEKSTDSNFGLIIEASAGALLLILAIAYIIIRVRRLETGKRSATGSGVTITGTGGYLNTVSLWEDPELLAVQLNCDDIEDIQQISHGAFATVRLVRYRGSQLLAFKRLKHDGPAKREQTQKFVDEIKIVANLQYPKIVRFIGAMWTVESDLQALFEYVEGGDLRTYLENPRLPRQWAPEKVQIAIDIVEALVYMHSFMMMLSAHVVAD